MQAACSLKFGGHVTYMENNLSNIEVWDLILTTHEKKLQKSVMTSSKFWHPVDSRWAPNWE